MPTVSDVLDALEQIAPSRYAFASDHIGLQVGGPSADASKIVVSLDPSLAAARFARSQGAQMLVCHHPVIWEPLAELRHDSYKGAVVTELVAGGVAFAAAHTNWDCAPGGINDVLAGLIGLQGVRPIGSASDKEQTKVAVTVPHGSVEAVTDAMSRAGAGVVGLYERCAFGVDGTGTFRGSAGSAPAIGESGKTERVGETRLEMSCPGDAVRRVIDALLAAHPYEEPAYDVYTLSATGGGQMISRVGVLPREMGPDEFRDHLDQSLSTRTLLCGPERTVRTVVVCGGAAADEWTHARGVADAFVTGEVPHHLMLEGSEQGVAMAACGHYATENPGTMRLADLLAERFEVIKFEPESGAAGRPR
jgi:dinuclear metal center YbgI/SA1388 family protein